MSRVYSVPLIVVQGLVGTVEQIVPADVQCVLRCFDVYWGGGTSGSPSVRLIGASGQTIIEMHGADLLGTSDPLDSWSRQWAGRQVLHPGQSFAVSVAGDPADVTLSGYHLSLP